MTSPERPSSPVARTACLSAEDRAALIARLSEQLATVPSEPPRPVGRRVAEPGTGSPPPFGSAAPAGTSAAPAATRGGDGGSARPAGRTAIGGSGTEGRTGRRRLEGGHPEDAPGDPEAVAKQICLRQLTGASKPRAALADVLQRRGIPDDVAASVLDRFTEVGLIDDEAYAAAYVSTKQRDRSLGTRALRTELRRKGLDDRVVTGAVADIDEADERERATALVARRIDATMAAGPIAARRRLVGLLARRGYPSGLAHAVVSEAIDGHTAASAGGPGFPADDLTMDGPGGPETDRPFTGGRDRARLDRAVPDSNREVTDEPDTDEPDVDEQDTGDRSSDGRSDRGGARAGRASRWPKRSLRSR